MPLRVRLSDRLDLIRLGANGTEPTRVSIILCVEQYCFEALRSRENIFNSLKDVIKRNRNLKEVFIALLERFVRYSIFICESNQRSGGLRTPRSLCHDAHRIGFTINKLYNFSQIHGCEV